MEIMESGNSFDIFLIVGERERAIIIKIVSAHTEKLSGSINRESINNVDKKPFNILKLIALEKTFNFWLLEF
jgi:hypothetical protein